jgi:hypothetical protein
MDDTTNTDTPETTAAVEAGAAALRAMLKPEGGETIPEGRIRTTPTKDGKATLADLNRYDNEDGIFSKDAVKQAAAVDAVRKLLAAEMDDTERDALANEDVQTLRSRFGIEPVLLPHPALQARFDTEAEAVGLSTLASWGVSSDVARDLHQHVIDVGVGNMGGAATEAQYTEFAEKFKGRISADQIAALVEWHRGLGR